MMMFAAQREKVGEVCRPAVAPPVKVVWLGVVEGDGAAGYRARGVDGTERSSLSAVGEAGGAAKVQLTVGSDHRTVAHDDRSDGGVGAEVLDPCPGDGDGDAPVDCRVPVGTEVGGVDHEDAFGSTESCRCGAHLGRELVPFIR